MKLNNGIEIPAIALGVGSFHPIKLRAVQQWNYPRRALRKYAIRPLLKYVVEPLRRENLVKSVAAGIREGFRLLDYSFAYGDGSIVADAIEKCKIDRQELFLTGRVNNRAQLQGPKAVKEQIGSILEGFRTRYLDLLMFHWPVTECYEATWKVICEAYERGLARAVGVANCHPNHIEKLRKCGLLPMVNQFEVHPLFSQKELIRWNQDRGIVVEAYTSIARHDDRLFRLPALHNIAKAHGKTPVQIVLRWHLQNGLIPVVRSRNMERQKENLGIFDFELAKEEMDVIDGFNINSRLRYDPDNCVCTIL